MTPRYYLSFSHLLLVVLVVFLVLPLWILTSNNKKHMLVDLSIVHSGSLIFLLQLAKLPEKDIVEMIFFPVVNEACRVFAEGIAVKAADLDISSLMGMGFPPYRFDFLQSERVSFHILGSCFNQFVLFGSGGGLCSGLILLDPSTFIQDWRNGQRHMENSLSPVPSWLNELQRVLLW